VKFPVSAPADNSSASLDVPSPDARARRTTRRTSISDMVQRYEAMGGSAASSPVSRQPNNSAQPAASLSRSATTTAHVSSPSSSRRGHLGAVGLPGLASDPSKKPPAGIGASDRQRVEHASPVGLPGLAIERKSSVSYSGRRSPMKFDATTPGSSGKLDAPVRPIPIRAVSPVAPAASEDAQPSSPEKPYQGVGRLIDQWQRKTADVEVPQSPVSRRRGGGGTVTGATASPRRAGVIAGRGAQD
jgi:AP2-associated kinase